MRLRYLISFSLALVLIGCGSSAPVSFRTETLPNGTLLVTNSGLPTWGPDSTWRLVEELRLGTADGDGPEQFGAIADLLVDSNGRIYILDGLAQEVRVFEPDGTFSHSLGGPGRGPGEFALATKMSLGPGDTLWIHDPQLGRRYSAFDPAGDFLTSYERRVQGPSGAARHGPDAHFIDWTIEFPDEAPNIVAGARQLYHPVRLGPGFEVRDTFPPLAFHSEMITTPELAFPQLYFAERLLIHQDAEANIWFAESRDYQIYRRTLEGDTTLIFTLPAEPAPVTTADRAEIRANYRSRPDLLKAYLDALPETKPVIREIFGDDAGHIYVVPELAGVPAGSVLDLFRDSGQYLGRIPLPVPMQMAHPVIFATATHLYYLVEDELDIPRLARFEIIKEPNAGVDAAEGRPIGDSITVFFTKDEEPYPVRRPTRAGGETAARLRAALEWLVQGPTAEERAEGVWSWFSEETADVIRTVELDSTGRATIDFVDLRPLIPNASTSLGSQILLQELGETTFQFPEVRSAEYTMEGSCDLLWEWLQYGCQIMTAPDETTAPEGQG